MADNVPITAGTGTNIASDDIAGVQYQRVKIGVGADGTAVDVSTAAPMPVIINDMTASGSLAAAAQTVALALNGDSAASIQLTGTWVGTVTFEGTTDGTNWVPVNAVSAASSMPATTATANGLYRLTPGGLAQLRANMTAWTSGAATVTVRASEGTGGIFANQVLPVTGSGVAGTAAAGVVTVQGIAGATPVPVRFAGSTGAQTSVASTVTTNTTLIAADATRVGLTIYNESTAILFVLLGAGTESATVYTVQIPANSYYEAPDAFTTMRASGHWAAANGSARITSAV